MPLPKTKHQLFPITIPSTKTKYMFRPFLVPEEKLLLTAGQSGKVADILLAIEQVIVNCSMDDTFNVDKLTTFDFDYVFIKLRAASVNNVISVKYEDVEDDKEYEFKIDLSTIEITMPDISNKITTDAGNTIIIRYPTMKEMTTILEETQAAVVDGKPYDMLDQLLLHCVDKIYDDQQVYDDYTEAELLEFFNNQTPSTYASIKLYLDNVPDLEYQIKYKNSLDHDRTINLKGIEDFFTFR